MIKNLLAFIFACVLIDFDRKFINGQPDFIPSYTSSMCSYSTYSSSYSDIQSFWSISISLAKGQLAGSVIILVSSLVFIGIYIYVYIRALLDIGNTNNNNLPIGG